MTERLQVYKCNVCGIVVEVLDGGAGRMICCKEPMVLLEEKTADKTTEKHVPVVERTDGGVRVVVGSTPHPMEAKHFIQLIEVIEGRTIHRQFLKPGDAPEASFAVAGGDVTAREMCNIHGLWKG